MSTENAAHYIGTVLREHREAQGREIDPIASALCVKAKLIREIESGRIDDVDQTLAVRCVKLYGETLRMSPAEIDQLVRRFKEEKGERKQQYELHLPDRHQDHHRPGVLVISLSLMLCAVIYGAWYNRHNAPELLSSKVQHLFEAQDSNTVTSPVSTSQTAETQSDGRPGIVLLARQDTWVRVKDAEYNVIAERTLKPGETFFVPKQRGLIITAGDSDAIEVFIDDPNNTFIGTLKDVSSNNGRPHPEQQAAANAG